MTTLMTTDHASMILRRKPQGPTEFAVARTALLVLKAAGMDQAGIEAEVGRGLSYGEELVLAEF